MGWEDGEKSYDVFISVVIIIVTTLMFVLFASGETDTNNIVFWKDMVGKWGTNLLKGGY